MIDMNDPGMKQALKLTEEAVKAQAQYGCDHYWMPNSGRGGEPEFRPDRQMSREPVMHVQCQKCGARTWFTEKQWHDIPVRTEP